MAEDAQRSHFVRYVVVYEYPQMVNSSHEAGKNQ